MLKELYYWAQKFDGADVRVRVPADRRYCLVIEIEETRDGERVRLERAVGISEVSGKESALFEKAALERIKSQWDRRYWAPEDRPAAG